MRLTERKIETLTVAPGKKDRLVFDDAQRGLAVRVTASGSRTYLCQYTLNRQKWRVPLGVLLGALVVEGARGRRRCDGRCGEGQEPGGRAEGSRRNRVGEARAGASHASGTHPGLGAATSHPPPTTIRRRSCARAPPCASPNISTGPLRPSTALRSCMRWMHSADTLRRKADRAKPRSRGTAIAGRTAAYGRACFAWAMKRGTVPSNPFAELPMSNSITKRERVLSDEEAAALWRAAGEAPLPYGAIVRLLMLTGQRREEVAGMTWAELSEDLATWTIPAKRTKNGAPHLVPLSQPARDLLHALRSDRPVDGQNAHRRVN